MTPDGGTPTWCLLAPRSASGPAGAAQGTKGHRSTGRAAASTGSTGRTHRLTETDVRPAWRDGSSRQEQHDVPARQAQALPPPEPIHRCAQGRAKRVRWATLTLWHGGCKVRKARRIRRVGLANQSGAFEAGAVHCRRQGSLNDVVGESGGLPAAARSRRVNSSRPPPTIAARTLRCGTCCAPGRRIARPPRGAACRCLQASMTGVRPRDRRTLRRREGSGARQRRVVRCRNGTAASNGDST